MAPDPAQGLVTQDGVGEIERGDWNTQWVQGVSVALIFGHCAASLRSWSEHTASCAACGTNAAWNTRAGTWDYCGVMDGCRNVQLTVQLQKTDNLFLQPFLSVCLSN